MAIMTAVQLHLASDHITATFREAEATIIRAKISALSWRRGTNRTDEYSFGEEDGQHGPSSFAEARSRSPSSSVSPRRLGNGMFSTPSASFSGRRGAGGQGSGSESGSFRKWADDDDSGVAVKSMVLAQMTWSK